MAGESTEPNLLEPWKRRVGLTYGSLFTGIGGIDLGLDRAGWECRWQVEKDPYASAVLAGHWPRVPRYGDIRTVDPGHLERVDMVCGGIPCQPTSVAGKHRGRLDERWLWPEFARILGGVRPRFALLENPPGLLAFSEFGDILGDLASLGFDAEWDCIPASALGAPHERDRVFVMAYAHDARLEERQSVRCHSRPELSSLERNGGPPSADSKDANRRGSGGEDDSWRRHQETGGLGIGRDGSEHWLIEPNVGRVANGIPSRVDRLKCLGNAVVPQVAEVPGRLIAEVA